MSRKTADRSPVIEQVKAAEIEGGKDDRAEYFDWRTFDPAMLKGGVTAPLAMELVTYRDRLDELLRHKSQYVVNNQPRPKAGGIRKAPRGGR